MSTKILFVGGSFGGLSAINHFIQFVLAGQKGISSNRQIELILLDPRAGFINLLGIPKAIIDIKFAREIYFNIEKYNLKFDEIETTNEELKQKLINARSQCTLEIPENTKIKFIHGYCTLFKDSRFIEYQLTHSDEVKALTFDYCVFATGRQRSWPFDPKGFSQEQFVQEMTETKAKIDTAQTVSIIGGGALGIEVAGEIKKDYPDKHVILIHPHPFLPPEVYASKNFKEQIAEAINKVGIDLKLNTRIKKELENGDLLTTTNEVIKSQLNYWCNFHNNNIQSLLPYFKDSINPMTKEVIIEDNFLVKGTKNIFVIGDIIQAPIVKTAGAAFHSGRFVAESLYNIVVQNNELYHKNELLNSVHGMTFVVGNNLTISQRSDLGDGEVVLNEHLILEYYKDYGTTDAKRNMNMVPDF